MSTFLSLHYKPHREELIEMLVRAEVEFEERFLD